MLDKNLTFGGVFFMSKYSKEFKLKVVKYCIENYHSYQDAANYFGIPSRENIRLWCKRYELYGTEGLSKKSKLPYSGEFKQNVIEYMHTNLLSATATAIHFELGAVVRVLEWERIYYEKGPQALYEEHRGRFKNMNSKQKKKISEQTEKDLIAEVQQLRMENEYLKKLNALVQERINRENKKK